MGTRRKNVTNRTSSHTNRSSDSGGKAIALILFCSLPVVSYTRYIGFSAINSALTATIDDKIVEILKYRYQIQQYTLELYDRTYLSYVYSCISGWYCVSTKNQLLFWFKSIDFQINLSSTFIWCIALNQSRSKSLSYQYYFVDFSVDFFVVCPTEPSAWRLPAMPCPHKRP